MALQYQLSTDEQIWVMIRVKQGLMSMDEALEYVRKQHEAAGLPPVVAPCHMYTNPRSPSSSPRPARAHSHNPSQQDRMSNMSRGRSLLRHLSRQRSPSRDSSLDNEGDCQGQSTRPKSVGTSYAVDREWEKNDELLDLMLAQGKISNEDHKELLQRFATVKNYKNGDAQRMILGNLVKTGRISIDDAVHYSRLLGIVSSAETEARTIAEVNNAFQDKRVYNFGVYKYYKHRYCQRRILQIDFQSCQVCNIQKGNLNRVFPFAQVTDYESEEGLRFFIYFRGHQDYELEADTQEEKQKICRLLCLVAENNKSSATGRVLTQADFRGTLIRCQQVIKEGFLEKKNHNLYTTYTRRWIRIREGELSYYKPDDDNQQALNILQLSDDVTVVKKLNYNGFSMTTRKKVYFFRIIPSGNASAADIEKERDEWFGAIRFACGDRSESVANFGPDDSFVKKPVTTSDSKHKRESYNQALRHFQEDLERLSLVVNHIDDRGEATKALIQLQQKAKVIESLFSEMRPSSDTSFSAMSTSVDTESSSPLEQSSILSVENIDQSYDDPLPALIQSDRHSVIIGNNWALHNNHSNGLTNGHSLIVDPPMKNGEILNGNEELPPMQVTNSLEQRTSMIRNGSVTSSSSNLSTVFERKCLRNSNNMNTIMNSHSTGTENTAIVNGNQMTANILGITPTRIDDELPPLPPPPPPLVGLISESAWLNMFGVPCLCYRRSSINSDVVTAQLLRKQDTEEADSVEMVEPAKWSQSPSADKRSSMTNKTTFLFSITVDRELAIREKLPPKEPPPPPPQNPTITHKSHSHVASPKELKKDQQHSVQGRSENKLLSSSISPSQKRRMWYVSQTNHIYPYKNPPPLPLRQSDTEQVINKVENCGPKYEDPGNPRFEIPPPLPPRQSAVDREVEAKLRSAEQRLHKTKAQQMAATKKTKNGGQSFWRNLKQAKVFSSSSTTSVNKNKSPPPLPPRIAANNDYSNEFPRQQAGEMSRESKDDADAALSRAAFIPPPPAPPPPPEMVAPITRKFEVTSKVKMRPFHWNKVSALMIKKSIWHNAKDLTGKIDIEFLQKMYSDKMEQGTAEPTEKVESAKKKFKSFLDPKVAQNLGIFLAGFKMDAEELKFRLAIPSEDDGGLSGEQINMLRRFNPTVEDIETYKKFKDRQTELESTDQFMLQLCEIPHLKTRLDVLMVINELPVQHDDLAPTIDRVHNMCKLLCSSDKFVSILEHVLAVGNFINSGSAQGVSMGFRLTTLPKLADCRGKDKTCTLLKFVVQQVHKNSPELLAFIDDFMPVTLLPDVSVKALEAEVEVMKRDLNNIKKNTAILLKVENPPERDIAFCDEVAAFVDQYDLKLTALQKKSESMKGLYEQMLERFAEPRGIESSDIFTAISIFIKAFKRELDLILAAAGIGRRKSKAKVNQSYLKKDRNTHFERVVEQSSCTTDSEKHIMNGGSVDETSPSHVAALRKAFSAEDSKLYSKHGREILKAFQSKKQDRRHIFNPTKEGYLEKLSNTKTPLTSSWNRRFFELTTKGHLYYSKRKNEKNVESIYLRGVPVALEDDKTLILQTEERCYKLRANSHKEAQEWLECLLFYTQKPANVPKRSLTAKAFEVQ